MRKIFYTEDTWSTITSVQLSFFALHLFGNEMNVRVIWNIPERTSVTKTRVYKYYLVKFLGFC